MDRATARGWVLLTRTQWAPIWTCCSTFFESPSHLFQCCHTHSSDSLNLAHKKERTKEEGRAKEKEGVRRTKEEEEAKERKGKEKDRGRGRDGKERKAKAKRQRQAKGNETAKEKETDHRQGGRQEDEHQAGSIAGLQDDKQG